VESMGPWTVLELSPVTGRRHQLRIHMAMVGCPIIGDTEHGRKGDGAYGLLLASTQLKLPHPKPEPGGPVVLEFSEPEPEHFERWRRHVATTVERATRPAPATGGCCAGLRRLLPCPWTP
ncbi:truC, partial [Symbiodinium pilosum]